MSAENIDVTRSAPAAGKITLGASRENAIVLDLPRFEGSISARSFEVVAEDVSTKPDSVQENIDKSPSPRAAETINLSTKSIVMDLPSETCFEGSLSARSFEIVANVSKKTPKRMDECSVSDLRATKPDSVQEQAIVAHSPLSLEEYVMGASNGNPFIKDLLSGRRTGSMTARGVEVVVDLSKKSTKTIKPDEEMSTSSNLNTVIKSEKELHKKSVGSQRQSTYSMAISPKSIKKETLGEECVDDLKPKRPESVQVLWRGNGPRQSVESVAESSNSLNTIETTNDKFSKGSKSSMNPRSNTKPCKDEEGRQERNINPITGIGMGKEGFDRLKEEKLASVQGAEKCCSTSAVQISSERSNHKVLEADLPKNYKKSGNFTARAWEVVVDFSNSKTGKQKEKIVMGSKFIAQREPKEKQSIDSRAGLRNPITGVGLGEDGYGDLKPKNSNPGRDFNRLTGEGR